MLIVAKSGEASKLRLFASTAGYCDTIEISSSRAFRSNFLGSLRPHCGSLLRPKEIRDRYDPTVIWCHVLPINQPSREANHILDRYMRDADHHVAIYRVAIALDFDLAPGVAREEAIEFIRTSFHLRYRRDFDEEVEYQGSHYSIRTNQRQTPVAKQTIFYTDRAGKLDGECDKLHFEIRLEKTRAVKAAGIEYPSDLLKLDLHQFIRQHIKIADHTSILQKIVDRNVASMTRDTPSPYWDPAKRVPQTLRRMGADTLTGFKRLFPRQFKRLKVIPVQVLNMAEELEWMGTSMAGTGTRLHEEVANLYPLSPAHRKRRRIRVRITCD
jgi:hypothetical protein